MGSRKQPKLSEARTHSSPKCPCLSTWNCSPSSSGRSPESHPQLFSPLHIHIPSFSKPWQLLLQNISRSRLCSLVPGPSLGLSTDISHLESRGSLSAVFLLPVLRTRPEGPCGHLRWVTSLPAQGPPVAPSHSGKDKLSPWPTGPHVTCSPPSSSTSLFPVVLWPPPNLPCCSYSQTYSQLRPLHLLDHSLATLPLDLV